jgi:hypothetical protein
MFILNGKPLSPDSAFTYNNIQYPANWIRLSTPEQKAEIGITEVPDPAIWDQRFYWGYDQDGNLIPKDHPQLVTQWSSQTRITAGTLLSPTDWMIVREVDNDTPIPADIKTQDKILEYSVIRKSILLVLQQPHQNLQLI